MKPTFTLDGIRVLDLGSRVSTAWCSRLLADFGAEVVCVEDEDGHPLRSHPPFDRAGASIAARYFLANKASVPATAPAKAIDALVGSAHIVVTNALPGDALDAAAILALNPRALVCAITAHGQDGERSRLPGNDLTANARSGWASVNGLKDRSPLKASGYQASCQAGMLAFGSVLCALTEQLANDAPGQIIDVAELEVLVSTAAPAPLRYQYSGFIWPRKEARDVNDGPVPVADGFFALTISRPVFWIKAMRILGLPDLADDKELQQAGLRPKLKERFADRLSAALSGWKRMALFEALGAERVLAGPVLRMDELGSNPQFLARSFFREAPSGLRYPGPFARMGRSAWHVEREAVPAGGCAPRFETDDVIGTRPVRHGADSGATGGGPLSGFRGLVLTQAWAGTYATELLALLGAEVIQLEVRGRLDSWRGTYQNPIPKRLQEAPNAKHAWNLSPLYNSVNLNKECITLDLSTHRGVEIFRGLVAHVDFVAENFSPRVMGNLGLDYDSLAQIRPDLVMASLSAYGATGPWSRVPGIGGTIEPSSGMSALLGYPDGDPLNSGQMYPDPVAGLCGFAAIALALLHRDRTGEGQYIDLSMQEANFTFIGDAWLEYALNGSVRGPQGNRHPLHAPQGIYPAQGEDQWIAIAVESDTQWDELCDLLALEGFRSCLAGERKIREAELEQAIAAVTRGFDKRVLTTELLNRGIPAAPVLDAQEVAEDVLLRARGHMVRVEHEEAGSHWQSGVPVHYSRTPGVVRSAAPLQGQHSFRVFERLLGMSAQEYESLVAAEISGSGPTAATSVENQA
ncbi:MAG: CoA transferase [Pseudomonadales bacterium]|nr:CoA transferase [Pseudomonadales bacterium]